MILLLLDIAGILSIWLLFIAFLGSLLTRRGPEIFLVGLLFAIVLLSWFGALSSGILP